jgi:hypothetical protein
MTIEKDSFCTDEALLWRESVLRSSTIEKRDAFTNKNANRHFNEGFVHRHYMLQSSRLYLHHYWSQGRKEPLSPYEATDCAIHLNAYYLNLRGTLDNLTWVLQHEWQLLAGVSEDGGRERQACYLFGRVFLNALKPRNPELVSVLEQHGDWARELANLRDPAAHRIPIYVPPSVMTTQAQVDEFKRIEAQADLAPSERADDMAISEIYRKAQAVADFVPVMIISTSQGLRMRSISKQVRYDHDKYLTIARAVVDAL